MSMSPSSLRALYAAAIARLPSDSDEVRSEIEQMLVDLTDATEQSDTGYAVAAAHEAFIAKLRGKGAAS